MSLYEQTKSTEREPPSFRAWYGGTTTDFLVKIIHQKTTSVTGWLAMSRCSANVLSSSKFTILPNRVLEIPEKRYGE